MTFKKALLMSLLFAAGAVAEPSREPRGFNEGADAMAASVRPQTTPNFTDPVRLIALACGFVCLGGAAGHAFASRRPRVTRVQR